MRILYLSCHSILEHDEVLLLSELGHEVFSPGAYVEPANPGDPTMRPGIPGMTVNPDIKAQYDRIGSAFPGQDGKDHLTREFVDLFDAVIVMHIPRWITNNWQAIKHKRVIWRTIGQSIHNIEQTLQPYVNHGLQVVRYSPMERNIPSYCGEDAIIRFYKDPEVYKGYTGEEECVITFAQSMEQRGSHCNYGIFERVTRPFTRKLFGPENNQPGFGMGKVTYEQQLEELRKNRVYFYTGTHPASYTLNYIEAAMTGMPIVAIGPKHGNPAWISYPLYEIQDFINNGANGFIADDEAELYNAIRVMMAMPEVAQEIGRTGREDAIRLFGKEKIKQEWQEFLTQ